MTNRSEKNNCQCEISLWKWCTTILVLMVQGRVGWEIMVRPGLSSLAGKLGMLLLLYWTWQMQKFVFKIKSWRTKRWGEVSLRKWWSWGRIWFPSSQGQCHGKELWYGSKTYKQMTNRLFTCTEEAKTGYL